jgi:ribonuclease HI
VAQGDSQLVLQQLGGGYKARSLRMEPLLRAARELKGRFASVEPRHVVRCGLH